MSGLLEFRMRCGLLSTIVVFAGFAAVARAQSETTSYVRVLSPDDQRIYYASGGRKYLGSLVHVHVSLATFDREVTRSTRGRPASLAEYPNRSVPILIDRRSEYLAQLLRKRSVRRGGQICVKGRIVSPSWAPAGKCFLNAHSLKRAPSRPRERPSTNRKT